MIDYAFLRNQIIGKLFAAIGVPVILSNQTGERPGFPFITYTITSPYLPTGGPIQEQLPTDGAFIITRHVEMVFSFTASSGDPDESLGLALGVAEYFQNDAPEQLRDVGITVVNVTNVANRDVFLAVEYERRNGLDVRFRVVDQTVKMLDTIDTATIQNEKE